MTQKLTKGDKPSENSMTINFLVDPKTGIAFKLKCVKERKQISKVLRDAVNQFLNNK